MADTSPFEALLGEIPAVDDPLGGLNDLDTDLDSFGYHLGMPHPDVAPFDDLFRSVPAAAHDMVDAPPLGSPHHEQVLLSFLGRDGSGKSPLSASAGADVAPSASPSSRGSGTVPAPLSGPRTASPSSPYAEEGETPAKRTRRASAQRALTQISGAASGSDDTAPDAGLSDSSSSCEVGYAAGGATCGVRRRQGRGCAAADAAAAAAAAAAASRAAASSSPLSSSSAGGARDGLTKSGFRRKKRGVPLDPGEAEARRQARLQRNRESALRSRMRKRARAQTLEERNKGLMDEVESLRRKVRSLSDENRRLRQQLADERGGAGAGGTSRGAIPLFAVLFAFSVAMVAPAHPSGPPGAVSLPTSFAEATAALASAGAAVRAGVVSAWSPAAAAAGPSGHAAAGLGRIVMGAPAPAGAAAHPAGAAAGVDASPLLVASLALVLVSLALAAVWSAWQVAASLARLDRSPGAAAAAGAPCSGAGHERGGHDDGVDLEGDLDDALSLARPPVADAAAVR